MRYPRLLSLPRPGDVPLAPRRARIPRLDSIPRVLIRGCVVTALVLGSTSARGTQLPFAPPTFPGGSVTSITDTIMADLNGNGVNDLVTSAGVPARIQWFENLTGDATAWTPHEIDTDLVGVQSIATSDMDGDGDLDVIAGSLTTGEILWYENTFANGLTWTEHQIEPPTIRRGATIIVDLVSIDLDADGDPDVVVADRDGGSLRWFENESAGSTWTERSVATSLNSPERIAIGDFDGDLNLDLAASTSTDGVIRWFENNGGSPPTFIARQVSVAVPGAMAVAAGDLDCDGDVDLASSSLTNSTVIWHENNGNGLSWTDRSVGSLSQVREIQVADLDRNGSFDLICASEDGNTVHWFESDGTDPPGFTNRTIGEELDGVRRLDVGDIERDGDLDVFVAATGDGQLAVLRNLNVHQNATFSEAITVDDAADGARDVIHADLDKDGDRDLIAALFDDNQIVWYENDGGTFTRRTIATIAGAIAVATADLDNDGRLDVVSAARTAGQVSWHRNVSGTGTVWTSSIVSNQATSVETIATVDMNRDGQIDILSTEVFPTWFENQGSAVGFTSRTITTELILPNQVISADLDGDGDPDAISSTPGNDTLAWHENLGGNPLGFTTRILDQNPDFPTSLFARDLDKDGDVDFVVASRSDDRITWFENNGADPPSFTPRTVSAIADGARDVSGADLDKDGDLDLISASGNANRVSIHRNDGASPPTFTEIPVTTDLFVPAGVVACDLDKDGCLDLVVASLTGNSVNLYENGGGQFSLTTTDLSPPVQDQGSVAPYLAIDFEHRGRAGDSAIELASLELRFEDGPGIPYSTGELGLVVSTVKISRDEGSGSYEEGDDPIVATLSSFDLLAGVQTFTLPDDDSNFVVSPESSPQRFFVLLELTAGAGNQLTTRMLVTHVTSSSSTAEDTPSDFPLLLQQTPDVSSKNVELREFTIECRKGNVNGAVGPVTDVLFVNGSPGTDPRERNVVLAPTTPLDICIESPPSAAGGSVGYVVYLWNVAPANGLHAFLPQNIGCTALPTPLSGSQSPQPLRRANTLGFPKLLGTTVWPIPPQPTPFKLLSLANGVGFPTTFYLQGLISDSDSVQGDVAVTNGILVRIEP